jgi:hypothetical protein
VHKHFFPLCIFFVAACAPGSGAGLNESGRPAGTGPAPNNDATLANIQAQIFTPICTNCHIGAAAPQGLRLDEANAFNDLVGVPSRETGLLRVDPFNPDQSYIVHKVEGTQAVGAQMPLGGPYLTDEEKGWIRQWIADGALENTASNFNQSLIVRVDEAYRREVWR